VARRLAMEIVVAKIVKLLGLFSSFLLLFTIASVLEGFVLSSLWEWFVVPLGVRHISIVHAIGICVLLDFLTYHYYDYKKSEEIGLIESLKYITVRPVTAYIVGIILHYSAL
jgi:hypothetical protein